MLVYVVLSLHIPEFERVLQLDTTAFLAAIGLCLYHEVSSSLLRLQAMAQRAHRSAPRKFQNDPSEVKSEPLAYSEWQSAGSSSTSSHSAFDDSLSDPPLEQKERLLMKRIAASEPPLPKISLRLVGVEPILSVSQLLNGGHERFKHLVAVKGEFISSILVSGAFLDLIYFILCLGTVTRVDPVAHVLSAYEFNCFLCNAKQLYPINGIFTYPRRCARRNCNGRFFLCQPESRRTLTFEAQIIRFV